MDSLSFEIAAKRLDDRSSQITAQDVELVIDSGVEPRPDALSPIELLLAAQAACFLKGIERLSPTLNFRFSDVRVRLEAIRPLNEAKIESLKYLIEIATDESDERLALMHKNLKKHGTIYNTISHGTHMAGELVRAS
jgi:uncharacterized OsmC-like protein